MKKEPIDYFLDITCWTFFAPKMLTENNSQKWVRVLGAVICIPYMITVPFTALPWMVLAILFVIVQFFL